MIAREDVVARGHSALRDVRRNVPRNETPAGDQLRTLTDLLADNLAGCWTHAHHTASGYTASGYTAIGPRAVLASHAQSAEGQSAGSRIVNVQGEIMSGLHVALRDAPRNVPRNETPDDQPVRRKRRREHTRSDPRGLTDLHTKNPADYRTHVHRCTHIPAKAFRSRWIKSHTQQSDTQRPGTQQSDTGRWGHRPLRAGAPGSQQTGTRGVAS